MNNRDVQATRKYHDDTKHSPWSVRNNPHFLDFANRPLPFKLYPTIEPRRLPRNLPQTGVIALSAIAEPVRSPRTETVPDFRDVARIFYFSAGITKRRAYPGGEIYFRAAACTGALYEIELYLVTSNLPGLDGGVYHFNPADVSLRLLRGGDFRGNLAQATAMEPAVAHAPAVSAASGLPAKIMLGFVDAEVNRLLDLQTRREVSLCLVPIGCVPAGSLPAPRQAPALGLETVPLSQHEVEYPAMLQMHDASSIETEEEVRHWRERRSADTSSAPVGEEIRLRPLSEEEQPKDTIEQVILRRGSTRTFDKAASITLSQLATILDCATRGVAADFLEPPGSQLNDLYLIVHSVQGLSPGAYFFQRDRNTLEVLKPGDFRAAAYHLGLEQQLPADACVAIFFLADLERILEQYGNRGYRAVQLEAGVIGGRMYLAAYAQRLGCTGLTFFDDDVTAFFSPHAKGKSAIFLLAIGKPLKGKAQ